MSEWVCDCPEPNGCYADGCAQDKVKPYFEMNNCDWQSQAEGCECQPCGASGKDMVSMPQQITPGDDPDGHLAGLHYNARPEGTTESKELNERTEGWQHRRSSTSTQVFGTKVQLGAGGE